MSLTLRDVACLTAFPCVMTLAQFLFKATAGNAAGRGLKAALPVFFRQPSFYAAMAAYAGATAYPFTALAFLLVPLVETLFFGVRANRLYWAGLALIVVGAALVGRAQVG
jgi:drug/metabolite transporter (DMT)-like permease